MAASSIPNRNWRMVVLAVLAGAAVALAADPPADQPSREMVYRRERSAFAGTQ